MINTHKICVLDFESDGKNPSICEPTELAAVMIEPRRLEIITDSEFSSFMRPSNIDDPNYFNQHEDTIKWHAKNAGKTPKEILQIWKNAPLQKNVWLNFVDYLKQYHSGPTNKGSYTAPLIAGYNILGFDLILIERLSQKYGNVGANGECNLFYRRDKLEVMHSCFFWFENLEEPKSYSMDSLREFFGIETVGSHTALKDVYDTAEILMRFMRLYRRTAEKVRFKNSFAKIIDEEKC